MKITEIGLENYRSIKQENFELSDFTILIGKNNSGKSNIIDSIRTFQLNHQSETHRKGPSDWWRKQRSTGKEDDIPINLNFQLELSNEEYERIIEKVSKAEDRDTQIIRDRHSINDIKQNKFLSKVRYKIAYNEDSSVDVNRFVNFDGEEVSIGDLSGSQRIYNAKIYQEFKNLEHNFESWVFVDPFREPEDSQTTHYKNDLDPSGKDLIQVLDSLHSNHSKIFDDIVEAYVDIMEGISDIRVEYDPESDVSSSSMSIVVEEDAYDTIFKSEDISSGSKEILVLLTQIYLADEFTDILIVEEPELHVHPKAEEKLFRILQGIVEGGTQVIVATHSDVFVNESEASNIVRVERDGYTQIRTLTEKETGRELAELGYNKSGLLQSEAVVFVEGRSDKRILKKFCENAGLELNSEGIAVVELEGIPNMIADAKSLVKLLYSFDIPYLFLRDKHDKTREEAQGELYDAMKRDDDDHWWEVSTENIHVWDSYGIESYLLDAEAIADGLEMSPSEVQEIIDHYDDTADKGEVLRSIYAEEHSDLEEPDDFYVKDRHGMEIATRIPVPRFEPEVEEVIVKIGELLDNWNIDQLNTPISP